LNMFEESKVFDSPKQKSDAHKIALSIGKILYPSHPLGFDDAQLNIAFWRNCPNQTLPIFWATDKEVNGKPWQALFPRKELFYSKATGIHLRLLLVTGVSDSYSFSEKRVYK